jgi:hypothetical protein
MNTNGQCYGLTTLMGDPFDGRTYVRCGSCFLIFWAQFLRLRG